MDEALYYMDQITAERLQQQLIDISTASSPYYKQNDRTTMIAKLEYQIKKLRNDGEDDNDVDDETVKKNLGRLKSFFGRKQKQFKEKSQ